MQLFKTILNKTNVDGEKVRRLQSDLPGPHLQRCSVYLFWSPSVSVLKSVFVFRTDGRTLPVKIMTTYLVGGLVGQYGVQESINVHIRMNKLVFKYYCIDPLGRPTVPVGSDHYIQSCRPSFRAHFSKSPKTKQLSSENIVIAAGETDSLAEWIIHVTCLSFIIYIQSIFDLYLLINMYREFSEFTRP